MIRQAISKFICFIYFILDYMTRKWNVTQLFLKWSLFICEKDVYQHGNLKMQGQIQDFQIDGAQKLIYAQHIYQAWSAEYCRGPGPT